jgi:hypothetical protein
MIKYAHQQERTKKKKSTVAKYLTKLGFWGEKTTFRMPEQAKIEKKGRGVSTFRKIPNKYENLPFQSEGIETCTPSLGP